ncbi:SDR family oxidoreductase [Shewanella aegiceratis]|uniref:SDR family oxidoreductase n=1 Tax=Shewanella aegiceratis TaxID=2864203 RepID=UPI001C654BC6|nr:SDR family oxidoreductase [Shewanella aegiceratis]QYJ81076.1 SDR family oxidoreductase [Shewanella aegiceratis]
MITSVAVVGCGWFGLPLAKVLVSQGLKVTGSKRSPKEAEALSADGIAGFALDLEALESEGLSSQAREAITQGLACDAIVINIPPGLRRGDNGYLDRLKRLKALMGTHEYQRIIFISTSGVYPAGGGCFSSESAESGCVESDAKVHSPASETLLAAEALFSGANSADGVFNNHSAGGESKNNCVVVRFAGLIGPKRHPGRFLAGRENVPGGNLAVNMVHLDDCIGAVTSLLKAEGPLSPAYNLCAPLHPTKAEFYQKAATQLGLTPPSFIEGHLAEDKRVDGGLITRELNYQYKFTDPLAMLVHC